MRWMPVSTMPSMFTLARPLWGGLAAVVIKRDVTAAKQVAHRAPPWQPAPRDRCPCRCRPHSMVMVPRSA